MKRLFLIFLLLITFNANAIAGSIMMLKMSTMTSGMLMDKSEVTDHSSAKSHTMPSMSDMNQCDSIDSSCDDTSGICGLCMIHCSAMLISVIKELNDSPQIDFELSYHVNDTVSIYPALHRPPRFI